MKGVLAIQIGTIALAVLAMYGFAGTARDAEMRHSCTPLCALRPNYAAENRRVPDFELEAYGGGKVRWRDFAGKVVVLNFWTSTCKPCLEELPSLARLARSLSSVDNAVLVTIATDETQASIRDTLKAVLDAEVPFPVLWDPESKVVADLFGTKLFPETWFIDADGIIRARVDGARDWSHVIVLDFLRSFSNPLACDVNFSAGRAFGSMASICETIAPPS